MNVALVFGFCRIAFSIAIVCLITLSASADDNWPKFRGENSTGAIESATSLPDRWSPSQNLAWKTDLPGRGWSSPIVWGDKVFLTSVKSLGKTEAIKKGLYFGGNRGTEAQPESSIHLKNSYASETPVTDGNHVFFYFGNVGVFCYDFWEKLFKAHQTRSGWGTAASPVLDGEYLYLVDDNEEESSLKVLNKKDGSVHLSIPREEKSNWSTPFIWHNEKRTEIVTPGSTVRSYDLEGKLLWSFKGMSSITIATPYQYDGKLFISSGYVLSGPAVVRDRSGRKRRYFARRFRVIQ